MARVAPRDQYQQEGVTPLGLRNQGEKIVLPEPSKNLSSGGRARAVAVKGCSHG